MRKISLKIITGKDHEPVIVENKNGAIANQEFWQGKPTRLVGFVRYKQINSCDLDCQTFFDNPYLAVGKYPIFADSNDEWYLVQGLVKQAEIIEE